MPYDPSAQPDLSRYEHINPPTPGPSPVGVLDNPPAPNPFLRSPLPPSQVLQPDILRQFYTTGNPQGRILPLQPNANAGINSTAQGIATNVVREIIGKPQIIPPPVTDGLIHGDAIWEIDPAYVLYRDDFGTAGITNGAIGQLGWNIQSVIAAPTLVINGAVGGFPNFGVLAMTPDTSAAGHGGVLTMTPLGGLANGAGILNTAWMPLLDHPNWQMDFVFCFAQFYPYNSPNAFTMANTSAYIGLGDLGIGGAVPRPYSFVGVRFDTDTTAPSIGDTTFVLEASLNAQQGSGTRFNNQGTNGGTFVSSITPAAGVWYRLTIQSTTFATVIITLSGGGQTTGPQTFTLSPPAYTNTGNTSALLNNFSTSGVMGVASLPSPTTNVNGYVTPAPGSIVTLSNFSGGSAFANGTYSVLGVLGLGQFSVKSPALNSSTPGSAYFLSCYPGVTPIASLCNDSTGGTDPQWRQLMVDFFSLVWNPGVGGRTATPQPNLARYF